MPDEREALLARLAELDEEDSDEAVTKQKSEEKQKPRPASEFRSQIEELRAELKRERTERQTLEKSLGEYRSKEADATFSRLGLTQGQRALFAKVNPDTPVTEEAVTAFLREYELPVPAGDGGETESTDSTSSETFRPTNVPSAASPGSKVLTPQEFVELAAKDPSAAQAAHATGRVNLSGLREGLGPEH